MVARGVSRLRQSVRQSRARSRRPQNRVVGRRRLLIAGLDPWLDRRLQPPASLTGILPLSSPGGINAGLPSAAAFPAHPAAWYFFCQEKELDHCPVGLRHWTRDRVAFRTESGAVAVLDARCPHLGANLSCGKVKGEAIQCPFHHWSFGVDGVCRDIPVTGEMPRFARQIIYPVRVRHGRVIFFNGPEATFSLPFFENEAPEDFVAAQAFSYHADSSWPMVASQGSDVQHFESVHDRRLTGPPELRQLSPFAFRCCYKAINMGEDRRDVILRWLVGRTVELTLENWGGTLFVIKAVFPEPAAGSWCRSAPWKMARRTLMWWFSPRGVSPRWPVRCGVGLPGRTWSPKRR
jgi:phenylpropionate dioxygenase-like ring-hydroxylating dioxygenase large terminal subunit